MPLGSLVLYVDLAVPFRSFWDLLFNPRVVKLPSDVYVVWIIFILCAELFNLEMQCLGPRQCSFLSFQNTSQRPQLLRKPLWHDLPVLCSTSRPWETPQADSQPTCLSTWSQLSLSCAGSSSPAGAPLSDPRVARCLAAHHTISYVGPVLLSGWRRSHPIFCWRWRGGGPEP